MAVLFVLLVLLVAIANQQIEHRVCFDTQKMMCDMRLLSHNPAHHHPPCAQALPLRPQLG